MLSHELTLVVRPLFESLRGGRQTDARRLKVPLWRAIAVLQQESATVIEDLGVRVARFGP